ncbi:MAG TPA: tyrosine-type recombinase/integrase [Pyrinomonadaceae bacterium]|nr:tyrosine-type recombinase/integrase [Pyrinomonadaceae bacterium]
MSLYKRGGVWWMNFWVDEYHVQRSTKCTNKRDAADVERAFRTNLAKGEVGLEQKKPVPRFGVAMKDYLAWSEQEHRAHPNTYKRYETSSKALLRFFGDSPLDRISPEEIEKYKAWRGKQCKTTRAKGKRKVTKKILKPATVNRELACLKMLFNYFIRADVLTKANPVSRVKFLTENNEQTRVLSNDEEKLYLLAASQPLQDIATMMVQTGMRPEEVCRIRRENVNINEGYLSNPFGKTKAAKRKIPLTAAASAVLSKRLAKIKGDCLFPGRIEGEPIVKVNAAHTATVKRCGVAPFRLYDLRYTWATRAAMAGVDLVTLAAMLGHSRIQMVLRYAHPTEEHQFLAMRKLEAFASRG